MSPQELLESIKELLKSTNLEDFINIDRLKEYTDANSSI